MGRNHHFAQIFLAELLFQGVHVRRWQKSPGDQKERSRTTDEDRGCYRREVEEPDGMAGLLPEKLAYDNIAAGANQSPLAAKRSPVCRTQKVAGRGKVALFAYPQHDRHENENNGGLVNEHGAGGSEPEYAGLEKGGLSGKRSEHASTDHLRVARTHHGNAEAKHRRYHDYGHAAKTGESFLRRQNP